MGGINVMQSLVDNLGIGYVNWEVAAGWVLIAIFGFNG